VFLRVYLLLERRDDLMLNLVLKLLKARDLLSHEGHPVVGCLLLSDVRIYFNKEAFTWSYCDELKLRVLPKPHPRFDDLAYLVLDKQLSQGFSIQMLVAVVFDEVSLYIRCR
jgi:hypothetical protein